MPTVAVFDMAGKEIEKIELNEAVFGIEPNVAVMHDVVKNILANRRQGSTRAPQWTHGGIVFAPKPRCYRYTLNKKVRRLAMLSALSSKVADNQMVVIDNIATEEYKTKNIAAMLKAVGAEKKALIVLPEVDKKVIASAANIPGVKTAQVNTLNVYDILNADMFIVAKGAVSKIEEVYA